MQTDTGFNLGKTALRRRLIVNTIGLGLMMPLLACGKGERKMPKGIVLNVVLYSYIDRVITDIFFNSTDLGVANKHGGTGTITGVRIPFGVQRLEWTLDGPEGMARNGEKVTVKNKVVITPTSIPQETRYLGLHLYPDDTAEVTFAEFIPDRTPRGEEILAKAK